jgi:hypothetical protein
VFGKTWSRFIDERVSKSNYLNLAPISGREPAERSLPKER